jgi:hypothetical protein
VSGIDIAEVDSLKALDLKWPIREEKHEPVSGIDIAEVDSLKALDLKWPIREADIGEGDCYVRLVPGATRKRRVCMSAQCQHRTPASQQGARTKALRCR